MLFKNLFLSSIILASSAAVFAAPPAAHGSPSGPIAKVKALIHSVREKYANDLKPHLKSITSNSHILGCAQFKKAECEKFESTLKDDERAVIHKIAGAFQSKISEKEASEVVGQVVVPHVERRDEDLSPLIGAISTVCLGLSALLALFLGSVFGVVGLPLAAVIPLFLFFGILV